MASRRQRPQHSKRNRRATAVAVVALAIVMAFAGVAAYAKYAHQATDDRSYAANSFCFSSDFLSEQGASYTLSAGTTQLVIELRNYDDALRWSDDDVAYSYEVMREDGGAESSFASGSGTIVCSADAGAVSKITVAGLAAGTYKVTATSTSPFSKKLTGTFTIPAESGEVTFRVSDSARAPYALLTVSTEGYDGDVTVSWPGGVFPDTTQAAFKDVRTYDDTGGGYAAGSRSVGSLGKFGSATYRFFKEDPQQDYSTDGGADGIAATPSSN